MPAAKPKPDSTKPKPLPLDAALRAAIEADARTSYALGKASGVNPTVIDRFVRAERTIQLDTAAKLAAALGLTLSQKSLPAT